MQDRVINQVKFASSMLLESKDHQRSTKDEVQDTQRRTAKRHNLVIDEIMTVTTYKDIKERS